MTKKVHELAKEMEITSKDLIEKLGNLGIEVKSHMSVLSDADIEKIKGKKEAPKAAPKVSTTGKPKPPVGKPVVNEEYFANKRKPPVGKPVVNEEYFANKNKKSDEPAEGNEEPKAAPAKEVKATAPAKEAKEAVKEATPAKAKEAPKSTISRPEPLRGPKIIKTAAQVQAEEKAADAKREARAAERKAEKNNAQRRDNNRGPRNKDNRGPRNNDGRSDDRTSRNGDNNRGPRNNDNRNSDNRNNRAGDNRNNNRPGSRPGANRAGDNRNDRNDRNDRGPRNNTRDGSDKPKVDSIVKPDHNKRADNKSNHNKYDKDRNKFAKLEKRSLEKQARKKHVKAKPIVVEPEIEEEPLPEGTVIINVPITVAGFCEQAEVSTSKVIMSLMKLGIMANINQSIDEDTVMVLAEELGISVVIGNVEEEIEEEGLELYEDKEEDLKARPPIITVMGHVDHGKTSLLDAIRKTNVTASESGGITQHIGASEVRINGQKIVFLDTPGHEAFTAMRARGAHVTDMAVLVVAADDSVKPQTIESISHAKAAGVPIIVAINKMDKPGANPDRVKQDLTEHGILVEDWGGDVISVPVSAKTGDGIVNLLEMILLQAEVMELKANPNRLAMGSVIEARLDKSKGPVASLLVTNGTLHSGDSIVVGTCSGRIRLMTDAKGKSIKKAGPATAVEILGLADVPQAGDEFNAVKEDKIAREIAEARKDKLREEVLARNSSTTLEALFNQIQ